MYNIMYLRVYMCVYALTQFGSVRRRSRVGNKVVNVEHVITGDVRLCACISRSTFLVSPLESGSDHVYMENTTYSRKLSTFK